MVNIQMTQFEFILVILTIIGLYIANKKLLIACNLLTKERKNNRPKANGQAVI